MGSHVYRPKKKAMLSSVHMGRAAAVQVSSCQHAACACRTHISLPGMLHFGHRHPLPRTQPARAVRFVWPMVDAVTVTFVRQFSPLKLPAGFSVIIGCKNCEQRRRDRCCSVRCVLNDHPRVLTKRKALKTGSLSLWRTLLHLSLIHI